MTLQAIINLPPTAYTITDCPRRRPWSFHIGTMVNHILWTMRLLAIMLQVLVGVPRPQRIAGPGSGTRWPISVRLALATVTIQIVVTVVASDLATYAGSQYISFVSQLLQGVNGYGI